MTLDGQRWDYNSTFPDKRKGILGGLPPGFLPKKALAISPIVDQGKAMRFSHVELGLVCPQPEGAFWLDNLETEIDQYLQVFKPKSLVEGFLIARQVENILNSSSKCNLLTEWSIKQGNIDDALKPSLAKE
ncbi:hypothetical protein J1N35_011210 [Gossypium stocksii]|uniref:Uncharacterized protein n=1 Tax=Gossypium stocksii TaxID=47602 RepID=A0A9D4ABA0_9ROSI|nr:hypothetical protein J1N35_011210 [Gossypium stocksii]